MKLLRLEGKRGGAGRKWWLKFRLVDCLAEMDEIAAAAEEMAAWLSVLADDDKAPSLCPTWSWTLCAAAIYHSPGWTGWARGMVLVHSSEVVLLM